MKINFKSKNPKGVSLVWAMVVMIVVLLIVTGILMMAQVFNKRENTTILETKADYYARSGINIMSSQIKSGAISEQTDLPQGGDAGSEKSYVVEITDNGDVIPVTVIIKRDKASYQLNLEATYTRANVTKTVCGRMSKSAGEWQFDGYYVE